MFLHQQQSGKVMSSEIQELQSIAHKWTVKFLEKNLPKVRSGNWWEKCVIHKLTEMQDKMLRAQNISTLDKIDLLTLLRVFEKNWRGLSEEYSLPRELRTLMHGVREFRNHLAHQDMHGIPLNDQIRYADTITRYLEFIGADANVVESAKEIHQQLMASVIQGKEPSEQQDNEIVEQSDHSSTTDEISERDEIVNEGVIQEPYGQLSLEISQTDTPIKSDGVPLSYLGFGDSDVEIIQNKLKKGTYIGIDFGTSTTVVTIMVANESGDLQVEPISIPQFDESGKETNNHILPSCIAWTNGKLLVGDGAKRLKSELIEGQKIWSSFKMKLGTDLGPQYPQSELAEKKKESFVIERPQDAAKVFFAYLRDKVEDYAQSKDLPARIYYSVSVPASFEANQRNDLINALSNAGILVDESSLIDEPNAAFLSYLSDMESTSVQKNFINKILEKERRVLVFDFGAGTCDISVLEVKVENERLLSRNLAISKFMALGGDDIDREIARKVLLPQLFKGGEPADISTIEVDNVVLPRLKPEAERLKIQCCRMIETRGLSFESLRKNTTLIEGREIQAITIQNQRWELTSPQIKLSEFAEVMAPFLNSEDQPHEQTQNQVRNVFEPIHNALEKSGLSKDDLHMLLFIGGSSSNPLVRKAIETNFGRFVECVTPRDLRTHVSKGSALHSLFLHGFNWEMIHPITSEAIYVITRNGVLEEVLPAGTEVPSPDINVTEFSIDRDGQQRIELPFCVGGADKVLGIVPVMCPDPQGSFKAGTPVRVSCSVTHEKLLNVIVITGETKQTAKIFNPLANTELTPQHRELLQARQVLNESILKGNGRPEVDVLLKYARALENAKRWRQAAETMVIIVEQLDPSLNLATNIAYLYSKDKDSQKTYYWSEEAYKSSRGSISAYNLALTRINQGNNESYEKLMEESISLDRSNYASLNAYGHYLMDKNDTRGREYIVSACEILNDQLVNDDLDEDDIIRLEKVAETLGKQDILESLRVYREKLGADDPIFPDEFLISPKNPNMMKEDAPAVADSTMD